MTRSAIRSRSARADQTRTAEQRPRGVQERLEARRQRPVTAPAGMHLGFAAAAVPPDRRADLERRLTASALEPFADFDALLIPTMGVASMAAGEDYADRPLLVDGQPLDHFCDAALTPIFNIANACPVLTVPSGLATVPDPCATATGSPSPGVPTGIQIAASPHQDATAFCLAATIEQVAPWPKLAP